jgi:hypothetical protein
MSESIVLPGCDGLVALAENERWLHLRQSEPSLAGASPLDLLTRTAALPGNYRLARSGAGVLLLGDVETNEVPFEGVDLHGGEPTPNADSAGDQVSLAERIEGALEASGFAWKRRERSWVVPAGGRLVREIEVVPVPAGVRVQSVLVGWDEIGPAEQEAIAWLLCRAQLGLRWARCEMDGREARVAALVATSRIDPGLTDSLAGVAAGSRLLAREVGALLAPELARAYLEFQGVP